MFLDMRKLRFILLFISILTAVSMHSQTEIIMEKEGGVFKVPCKINGLRLKFIFDTGASNVCLSENIALMMLENDYLKPEDIQGSSQSIVADGRIVNNTKVLIRKIEIGDKILENIEAVIIHNQQAPLLLGQSAIKRLGKYSISGNKLIFGTTQTVKSQPSSSQELTLKDVFLLKSEADEFYNNNAFEIAEEKYEKLLQYRFDGLKSYMLTDIKFNLADCYYYNEKTEKSLSMFLSIEDNVKSFDDDKKGTYYFQIMRCYWLLNDYNNTIKYAKFSIYYNERWSENYISSFYILASTYYNNGNGTAATYELKNVISEYLQFLEINATDCWNKKYKDDTLAILYSYLAAFSSDNDIEKYSIISAAWGNKDAVEMCKEIDVDYNKKPYKYEY